MTRLTFPPNYPAKIDQLHDIGAMVRFAVIAALVPTELCTGTMATGTQPSVLTTAIGNTLYPPATPGTRWPVQIPDLDPFVSGDFSVCWYGYVRSNVQGILLNSLGTSYGWYFYLDSFAPAFNNLIMYSMSNASLRSVTLGITDNTLHMLGMRYNSVAATVEFFMDGVSVGSGAWTKDPGAHGVNQTFSTYDGSGGTAQGTGIVIGCKGMLSDVQMKAWYENPWCIFEEEDGDDFIPAGAPPPSTVIPVFNNHYRNQGIM